MACLHCGSKSNAWGNYVFHLLSQVQSNGGLTFCFLQRLSLYTDFRALVLLIRTSLDECSEGLLPGKLLPAVEAVHCAVRFDCRPFLTPPSSVKKVM